MAKSRAKKKIGIFVPEPVIERFEGVSLRVSKREKWLVYTAALVAFLKLTEAEQNEWIRRVNSAALPGGEYDDILPGLDPDGVGTRRMAAKRRQSHGSKIRTADGKIHDV